MSRIVFARNTYPEIEVTTEILERLNLGENGQPTLLQVLQSQQIPVGSSCLGKGSCGKCRLKVRSLSGSLPSPSELERQTLERNGVQKLEQRLSCQLRMNQEMGVIEVDATYW